MDSNVVRRACSPVEGVVEVVSPPSEFAGTWVAAAEVKVAHSEPVFAGHYPHFPLFPGVCLVECIHQAAHQTLPEPGLLELTGLDSVRLLGPVVPGDLVSISLTWRKGDDDTWACAAEAQTERGRAAAVKLQYVAGGAA